MQRLGGEKEGMGGLHANGSSNAVAVRLPPVLLLFIFDSHCVKGTDKGKETLDPNNNNNENNQNSCMLYMMYVELGYAMIFQKFDLEV